MSIIQQLEDLKEWSKDSTRYERRLAFRRGYPRFPMGTEAGTIPIEWDELSDREREYYRTGPWSTREDYRKGQLVQPGPGRPGYSGEHSFKPLTTATEKAHYERQYGKKYNEDDWRSGNFEKKKEFSSGKKKVKRDAMWKRSDFKQSLKKYLGQEAEFNKLSKRGYISISELNKLLGGKDTQQAVDTLSKGLKNSPWVEEIKGAKNWKTKRLTTDLSMIEGGGKVFYKKPSEDLLKRLKSYYRNQEYLSDFKYGRVKGNTIKNVQLLYDDEVLMDSIKKWTAKDKKVPLKIIEAIFGDGMTGPNSVMQLGKALKGDIKIPGVRKNVALGEKIIEAMAWEARKGRGPWQGAAYEYAKGEMDNLFELKKGQWNFNKYYNETRKIMNEAGVPGVIDEVISLRTGFKNNQQVYSIFSQVIDENINDRYKTGYDSHFSQKQNKIRDLMADKPEGWEKQVDDLVRTQEGNYKKMKTRFGDVEFGRFGKFDVNTGTFQNPIEVFGEKRWNQLPKDIQAKILQGHADTGISLNVGKTQTQKELYKKMVPKATKISVPAGSSRVASVAGVLDDAFKTKTAKKVGSFLTKTGAPFEAGFIVTDYYNNLSRGMSKGEAWQTALSNATFGIYEGGSRAREKGLIDLAEAQGYSDWQVDSLKTMMSYNKLQKELQSEKIKLKQLIAEQESGVTSVTGEDVAGAIEQQKDLISKMEQGAEDLTETYWKGMPEGEDFNTGKMFDDLLGYKARQEYNETVEDKKHRVNPDMGEIGSPLWEALSDWRTFLPQNLMETTQATQPVVRNLRKLPGILGAMWDPTSEQAILSAMTPEEREERALRLNVKKQTYDPMHQTSTMTYDQMDPYYADFGYMYADGGIAGIRRPWAIPPESGPMPQGGGLSSQYNRVKKLTG